MLQKRGRQRVFSARSLALGRVVPDGLEAVGASAVRASCIALALSVDTVSFGGEVAAGEPVDSSLVWRPRRETPGILCTGLHRRCRPWSLNPQ